MFDRTYSASRGVIRLKNRVKIYSSATSAGDIEKEGPLGDYFDLYCEKDQKSETWEKAESEMARIAFNMALSKSNLTESNIDLLLAGDLINQCTGTGYGLSDFDIPFFGLYGACSTFAEGLILASLLIDGGHINSAGVVVSSHFCSAERQFRFPLEYGSFGNTTAQTTVTGAGALILARADEGEGGVFVKEVLPGIVSDRGINDASNMGAAMATAAADTIARYLQSTRLTKDDFDLIATGDLGKEGHSMATDMLRDKGIYLGEKFADCGMLIYDLNKQDVGCGGSGCGCSALCTAGYFVPNLQKGNFKNIIIAGTGALMSPQSLLQGLSIPSVAHLVKLSSEP